MRPLRDMPLTMLGMLAMAMVDTMVTSWARGLLMLMLMPTTLILTLMPLFPLAQALVLTQSPRVLMPPLRDMLLTMLGMLAMAMGLLPWQVNCDSVLNYCCFVIFPLTCYSVPFEMSVLTCNIGRNKEIFTI